MPRLSKKEISQYFGTECQRQLRLDLTPDSAAYQAERTAQGMPPRQPPRPGLEQITQLGEEWQATKLNDLRLAFDDVVAQALGHPALIGNFSVHASGQHRYREIRLEDYLQTAQPPQFLVEAQYEVGPSFEAALSIGSLRSQQALEYAQVRPDLIQVLPARTFPRRVLPNGDTQLVNDDDDRLQLRIIDIKLTAEPSPGYFAEVTYYSMTLAGWLIDKGLDHQYVVSSACAIWPGSHDASVLTVQTQLIRQQGRLPTVVELYAALYEDLEITPFEVFAFRIRRFFDTELPFVLATPWRDLDWHVDNRCSGCEYLGYPRRDKTGQLTNHPDQCMPMAARLDHLSRIAFVSRGASASLRSQNVNTVLALSQRNPQDSIYETHQILRATRTRSVTLKGVAF